LKTLVDRGDIAHKKRILESVMNRPEVLPHVAPGMISVTAGTFFDDPTHLMFGDMRGVALFHVIADGLVEGHYLLTNEILGAERLAVLRGFLTQLFTNHDAWAIQGKTPRDMLHARCMNRALGFRPVGTATDADGRECIKYILERSVWARLSAQA
jgi:hypothetical protein